MHRTRQDATPQETFVVGVTALLTTLTADIADDTGRWGRVAVVPRVEHQKNSR